MPFIGDTGQFSNIHEKNYADTTLRIIEGDAAYQSYNPADSHYKLTTTLSDISNVGATTSRTIEFGNVITSFTTTRKAGIMNTEPIHTLDLGSNVYIDDIGVDKIYVRGPAYAEELKSESVTVTNSVTTRDIVTDRVFAKTNGFIGFESNIGLLNTAPIHTLDIGANVQIDEYGSNTFYTSGNVYAEHFKSSNVTVMGGIEANDLIVGTNKLFVDVSTSRVGVNTTSPGYTLDVSGDINFTGSLTNSGTAVVSSPWLNGTNTLYYTSANVGIGVTTAEYELHVVGNIYASGTITELSDARFKENIEPIGNALDKVCSIGGYTYNKIGSDEKMSGVIAQEVANVLPEVVRGSEDTNYSVSYGNMVGLLIEAIKELKSEIDELKKSK